MKKEFYIVNDIDKPCPRLVAQVIDLKNNMEYLHPELNHWDKGDQPFPLSKFSTNLKDFGLDIVVSGTTAVFKQIRESVATYKDGRPRQWQGDTEFTLETKPIRRYNQ